SARPFIEVVDHADLVLLSLGVGITEADELSRTGRRQSPHGKHAVIDVIFQRHLESVVVAELQAQVLRPEPARREIDLLAFYVHLTVGPVLPQGLDRAAGRSDVATGIATAAPLTGTCLAFHQDQAIYRRCLRHLRL